MIVLIVYIAGGVITCAAALVCDRDRDMEFAHYIVAFLISWAGLFLMAHEFIGGCIDRAKSRRRRMRTDRNGLVLNRRKNESPEP